MYFSFHPLRPCVVQTIYSYSTTIVFLMVLEYSSTVPGTLKLLWSSYITTHSSDFNFVHVSNTILNFSVSLEILCLIGVMLQTLSPREETAVHKLMQKRAATQCESFILDFVKCSKDRTISIAWACTEQKKAMITCMHNLTREDHLEEARNIYMLERKRKREEASLAQNQQQKQQ